MKRKLCTYTLLSAVTVAVILFFAACSTSKDKWQNRKYHQITAHYNAYWNGEQAYKQAQKTVDDNFKDDFTKILPVFKFPDANTAKSIKSNTDRAIEKSSKVIKKHSMRFSGVEKNPEIDDAYLLIGKSCLISRDFIGAEAAFKYVIGNWKRTQSIYEPMVWLALCYNKQGKFSESELVLQEVEKALENKKAPKKLRNFMLLVSAENNISQGKTYVATENFNRRKKSIFKKSENCRIKFIEGQIYLEQKEYNKAYKCFQYVYRKSSDYNMQFVAKLNQAMCFEAGDERSVKVINDLENLLDKEINRDYQDQIYYAIGEIYYRNRNITTACKKWEQSVSASKTNTTQKTASAIRCADVYYNTLTDYKKAYMYYDTALALIDKSYKDFRRISDRHRVLKNLVENLNTVEKWDSLIALSLLPKEELDKKIDGWITEYKLEQKRKEEQEKLEKAIAQRNLQISNLNQGLNRNQSAFYFYNPTTVQSGKIEFERKWGKRALEDNWRLEQKEEISFDNDIADNQQDETNSKDSESRENTNTLTPASKEYYTKDIPFTQGAKDTANELIADALLDAGYIYWQGINNNEKAVETLLELQKRYPTHKNIPPSSYHLYKIYDEMGDFPASNYYKNKILQEFPTSEFAVMIENPSFWDSKDENNSAQDSVYRRVYDCYANKEYQSAVIAAQKAVEELKIGPYIPRLMYLSALSKGKLYGIDSLADNLNTVIYNYPSSEVTPVIEKQLQYLANNYNVKDFEIKYDRQKEQQRTETEQSQAEDIVNALTQSEEKETVNRDDILDAESLVYRYKDGVHYYVLLADDSKFDAGYIQQVLDSFNVKNFSDASLITSANLFTSTYQIINVKKFANIDMALQYFDSISTDSTFQSLNASYYKHFVISIQNYATFYSKRNIDAYMKFFRIMYLENREKDKTK
ncbi:MAG: tetratricopeptide repeat protein [Bacteroidales bacterium]|nr:tetratricopeptide repeat protein [Bacteroidales bacterium]